MVNYESSDVKCAECFDYKWAENVHYVALQNTLLSKKSWKNVDYTSFGKVNEICNCKVTSVTWTVIEVYHILW